MNSFEAKIQFGKSNSAYYKEVCNLALKFQKFSPIDKDKPNTIIITEKTIADDSQYLESLWSLLSRWKSTQLSIDGELKAGIEAHKAIAPLLCYGRYHSAIIKPLHCRLDRELAGWGCKLLRCIELHTCRQLGLREQLYWYNCGHFISDDIWKIDKGDLRAILNAEIEAKHLEICPVFDRRAVLKKIENLPNEIDLSQTNQWERHYLREPGLEPVLIGIRPKTEFSKEFERLMPE